MEVPNNKEIWEITLKPFYGYWFYGVKNFYSYLVAVVSSLYDDLSQVRKNIS